MLKRLMPPLAVLLMGLFLIAATPHQGWLESYWAKPVATGGSEPHDWSDLERDMAPEACAQCHAAQFNAWQESQHSLAYSPGLIGQFPHLGLSASNGCLKCHAPLAEQRLPDMPQLHASLAAKLKQPLGFDREYDMDAPRLPLRHAGVTCAACHVRGWQRFGPPQRDTGRTGPVAGAAHGGFTGSKKFSSSQFCASCHQFPQTYAINGKPMENTLVEWQQSRFAAEGVQCQTCHMPDRKHAFKGIHDAGMVRKGLTFKPVLKGNTASLTITSTWIGHAFPTYVTPKVTVSMLALDRQGGVLEQKAWSIERRVAYSNGWQELSDTRLLPGESRVFTFEHLPQRAASVRFSVDVVPDHFYKGVYQGLLADSQQSDAKQLIERALQQADRNDYQLYLYDEERKANEAH
ncbi:MAG: hypothetical protein COW18_05410 [Zetaproteobacteria bacterium CG12_big_fil_rev_8_21_14_0_65_54_13]|nr:MAG: hypothetical protein COX55_05505 [Zetaproteobacteria bacterium CG23_combo_of_CG06-09_8_20_14_all_54_7]PIW49462.1 MAG: hypothetical protein COW18_05410 [Zetaproteobacteria bacterium CG12_big_fil_rev_8_21_14_0_65_54_13]PIX54334.1 MAG: hypothetical protein COZ50_08470 [Zetaproteobacteria bacterium CG_4_10_14_3_um_filter_54_28]PJA28538.1 MAG: hypothetical protein CO188_09125 [Zetaproteobacteria bacterium CG_4_9_14_3_um_filter_54_145]